MKSLVNGCAAAALLAGLAFQAHAQIPVRDAPVRAVPVDEDDAPPPPPAAPAPVPIVQPEAASAPVAEAAPPPVAVQAPPAPVKLAEAAPPPVEAPRLEKARLDVTASAESPLMARTESAAVKALTQPKAAPAAAPTLTPEENAFFAVLGQRVTDAASAYESYVRRAAAIDPAFSGAASVQRAVKASAAYQPRQLEEGIVAYAALVALRTPQFVEGVRSMDPRLAQALASSPEQVLRVRGAAEAASDVAGVLRAQGASLTAAGKAITKAAYDIQSQSWSKSPVRDPQIVLADAKTSALAPRSATVASKEKLLASLVTAPKALDSAGSDAPDVVRGLALAALAILGQTGDGKEAQYEALMRDSSSADCLKMAKLNLNQCLAVAGPQYEDVYCSGRHAVADTGKCVSDAASGGTTVDVVPAPEPVRQQRADGYGPEQAEAYGQVSRSDLDEDSDDDVAQPVQRRYAEVPHPAPAPAPVVQQPAARSYAQNDYAPPVQAQPQYQAEQSYAPPSAYGQQAYQQPQYSQPQYQPAPQYRQPYYPPARQYYQQQPYGYGGQGYYGR
jgi:hypothetical protein